LTVEGDIDQSRLKLTAIRSKLQIPAPEDAPDATYLMRARCYALWLIYGLLFPDTSRGRLQLAIVPFVVDTDVCQRLSWGSAVLAYLYRQLCKTVDADQKNIGGCCLLMQLWAWERITVLRPTLIHPDAYPVPGGPRGARWRQPHDMRAVAEHTLTVYRDQLSSLVEGEVS